MWIFLSTILVLLVFSAGFRKGCLATLLIIIGFSYFVWREYTPHRTTPETAPASTRALRSLKPSKAKHQPLVAEQRSAKPQVAIAPPPDQESAASVEPADDVRSDP